MRSLADWARAHLTDPSVRFVEVDVDTTSYEQSHLPGAIAWNWTSQLSDGIRRDVASREDLSRLLSESGIGPGTTVVLYGDNNNWFAAYAFWLLRMHGHQNLRLMDGGRNQRLDGTNPWKPISVEFEVQEDRREVEFTAEVRCKSGRAWFDKNGFRLLKLR